jgi:glycosyltransferase involved in cell wall biosynthesis
MPTVAVFSPSLRGHRQTYCRVLAQILLDDGLDVLVIAGVDRPHGPWDASDAPQLRELESRDRYRFIGLPESSMTLLQRSPAGFMRLLDDVSADAVLLSEADACISLLNSRILRRGRPRRWVGLFIRTTNYVHECAPGGDSSARTAVRRVRRAGRRLLRWRNDPRLFHEILLPRLRLLDRALYLDESFAGTHGENALWLPDIFASRPWRDERASAETRTWAERLARFMAANEDRPAYVYLGAPQRRRGYDTLLRLAVAQQGCLLHCGRVVDGAEDWDGVGPARAELLRRGALFETGAYYENDATADLFLERAQTMVLPHRGHLGSSGVMLQALAAGRPVLVPDQGLMADRVRACGLGRTYRAGDWDDLLSQDRALRAEGSRPYAENIGMFMSSFSRAQVESAVRNAMGYGSGTVPLPVPLACTAGRDVRP